MLEMLEQANLFTVPLDHERRWYRYHHLFADFLQSRLRLTRPELVPELHRRAADWYEHDGLIAEAIDHALAAQDHARAGRLIDESAVAILMRGEVHTLCAAQRCAAMIFFNRTCFACLGKFVPFL